MLCISSDAYICEVQVMGSIINELSTQIGKRWLGQSENILCLLHTGSSRVGLEGGVGVIQIAPGWWWRTIIIWQIRYFDTKQH